MPLIKLRRDGQGCYKFGKGGKVFCGVGARARAARQGRAIKAAQARRAKRGR